MPFNGNGVYAAPASPGAFNPAVSGSSATPTAWNDLLDDIETALSTVICKDGQTTVTADIPLNSHKLTGLSAGTAAGNSVRFEQVFPTGTSLLATLQRSYLAGLTTSRGSATTIGVAAGICMDDTNVQMMVLSAGTINCATTGADGLDTGSLANNTWYHVFGIAKTDGTTSRIASTSPTTPSPMPSGYTLKRRISSFKTNGSAQIIAFTQVGDEFRWTVTTTDVNGTSLSASGTHTLNVPTGITVQWFGRSAAVAASGSSGTFNVDLLTPGQTGGVAVMMMGAVTSTVNGQAAGYARITTNTSAQLDYTATTAGSISSLQGYVTTHGWIDRRGRED